MFMQTLQEILRENLVHQTMKSIDHYPLEKNKKVVGIVKDELGGRKMKEFVALRPKKKQKVQRSL